MTARAGAALAAAATTILAGAVVRGGAPLRTAGPLPPLSARFVLDTIDGARADQSTGTFHLSGLNACLFVEAPLKQEMRLGPKEMVLYYPDRDLALVGTVSPRQAPPLFEALVVALSDPTRTLPPGSTLLERKQTGGVLLTRWRVVKDGGDQVGEMRLQETRDGAAAVEIVDHAGRPQRRFAFGDRVRLGSRSVPRTIEARYYTAAGVEHRRETWTLSELMVKREMASCARVGPKTKVQELAW